MGKLATEMIEYTYLLSYPRSGNHWMRYIVEWFSGMYTTGDIYADDSMLIDDDTELINPGDPPIFKKCDMPHLHAGPILRKRHKIYNGESRERKLLMIRRDPLECVVRQLKIMRVDLTSTNDESIMIELDKYKAIERTFAEWSNEKMLVDYESLKAPDAEFFEKLFSFLSVDVVPEKINYFIKNITFHKENAFSSVHAKNDTSFYSDEKKFHSLDVDVKVLEFIKIYLNK